MKNYSERKIECRTDTQYIVHLSGYKWCENQLGGIENATILDAACGSGYGSFYLAQNALRVIGIDRDISAIKFAKKRYSKSNLKFLPMDSTALSFADSVFDAIISQDTIEHIREDNKFLSEIKRVLKPNGIFFIFTPNSAEYNTQPANIYHIREYDKDSFEKLLSNYFREIRFYGRRLSERLAELEAGLNRVRRYDKLGIRMMMPKFIRHSVGNWIAKLRGVMALNEVSCADIEYFGGIEGTHTLIAICKNV